MDATLINFSALPLFEKIQENGFFSINMDCKEKEELWGKVYPVTYTTFFLASCKGNGNMKACVEFYNEYYQKHDFAIDYFMNDYMLILCMKHGIESDQLRKIEKCKSNTFVLKDYIDGKTICFENLELCPQKLNRRTVNLNKLKESLESINEHLSN